MEFISKKLDKVNYLKCEKETGIYGEAKSKESGDLKDFIKTEIKNEVPDEISETNTCHNEIGSFESVFVKEEVSEDIDEPNVTKGKNTATYCEDINGTNVFADYCTDELKPETVADSSTKAQAVGVTTPTSRTAWLAGSLSATPRNAHSNESNFDPLKNNYFAFACKYCPYRGKRRTHMERHVCTAEKAPFVCTQCPYKTWVSYSLKRHLLLKHSGNVPFHRKLQDQIFSEKFSTCSICGKKFSCAATLKIHMRIHTGEHQYSCQYCDYRANEKGHLNRHLFLVHNEELYSLPLRSHQVFCRPSTNYLIN